MAQPSDSAALKVGFFLIATTALAVGLLVYVGVKKRLFAEKVEYTIVSTTGENIERGMPIRLKGFKIGNVDKVDLLDLNVVKVDVSVFKDYMRWFTEGAEIKLETSLIGGAYLNLVPGPENAPVISPGATIPLKESENLQEVLKTEVEKVLADVKVIVKNARAITEDIVDEHGPVQSILANAKEISDDLASRQGLLHYVSADPRPVDSIQNVLDKADDAVAKMNALLAGLNERVDNIGQLQESIQKLVDNLSSVVAEYKGLRRDLQPTLHNVEAITAEVRNATTDLVRMRRKAEYGLALGSDVLERLLGTWPLSRGESAPPAAHPSP